MYITKLQKCAVVVVVVDPLHDIFSSSASLSFSSSSSLPPLRPFLVLVSSCFPSITKSVVGLSGTDNNLMWLDFTAQLSGVIKRSPSPARFLPIFYRSSERASVAVRRRNGL